MLLHGQLNRGLCPIFKAGAQDRARALEGQGRLRPRNLRHDLPGQRGLPEPTLLRQALRRRQPRPRLRRRHHVTPAPQRARPPLLLGLALPPRTARSPDRPGRPKRARRASEHPRARRCCSRPRSCMAGRWTTPATSAASRTATSPCRCGGTGQTYGPENTLCVRHVHCTSGLAYRDLACRRGRPARDERCQAQRGGAQRRRARADRGAVARELTRRGCVGRGCAGVAGRPSRRQHQPRRAPQVTSAPSPPPRSIMPDPNGFLPGPGRCVSRRSRRPGRAQLSRWTACGGRGCLTRTRRRERSRARVPRVR